MKYTSWKQREIDPNHLGQAMQLVSDPLFASLLAQRGLITLEEVDDFFTPTISSLESPWRMHGMKQATSLLLHAIQKKERIALWGDYDVDGIVGTAILHTVLTSLTGIEPLVYFPHRVDDGYGLNKTGIDSLVEQGAKLLITIDCGSTNHEQVTYARSQGLTVVITDHHTIHETLPDAHCIINPRQLLCTDSFDGICGATVAWKLGWALLASHGNVQDDDTIPFLSLEQLPLVALATVADIVPLTGENRTLVSLGLKGLKHPVHLGLSALITVAGLQEVTITTYDIGYKIAPRLNASGRMAHAKSSFRLLTTKDPHEARLLALKLEQLNNERRALTDIWVEEALEQAKTQGDSKVLIVSGKHWSPGIVGLLASRLVDTFHKPVLAIGYTGDHWVGSARSLDALHITKALAEAKHLLLSFGGHAKAAGFSIESKELESFSTFFCQLIDGLLDDNALIPILEYDLDVSFEAIKGSLHSALERFSPFGHENRKPLCITKGVQLIEKRKVGKDGKHVKCKFKVSDMVIDGIGFNLDKYCEESAEGTIVDVAYHLDINTWQGATTLQLHLVDMRLGTYPPLLPPYQGDNSN